ncbi:ADP-ribosylglycohydrolase family protein [Aureispira anguillae]|uniref:ADP-ribosylglycohydrolase family protein n=1 Tax=Aureispira anguillae TaxID=2864201 RepID=A0A916DT74_9BACT|nr:ADP-ribosylglycohydrolase family protein [Aureispira anguillae]BDS11562.1 ADP-ribosylglycohydrolase family protein [Aureispira anguillae]
MNSNIVTRAFLGLAIGDALGLPVEFIERKYLKENPVKDFTEFGTHNQPKGTWSDDSSLTFCLAQTLTNGYHLKEIAASFVCWYNENYWTARGHVFDIGASTSKAIQNIIKGIPLSKVGGASERDNGNGSLMRILPLCFYLKDFEIEKRFAVIKEVSSITHAHSRSILCCFIYIEICIQILKGESKRNAYYEAVAIVNDYCANHNQLKKECFHLKRVLGYLLEEVPEHEIYSSGYVVHSLEAAIWCWLKEDSYEKAVLKAVNLGDDSDTIASITGGLAGLSSKTNEIPKKWIKDLAKVDEIIILSNEIFQKYF